ncbi:MAG: hypothetical protein ACRENN_05205 [Candidatus Eiseniibacteriota bacterium]
MNAAAASHPLSPTVLRAAAAWALAAVAVALLFSWAALPQLPPASDAWDYAQEARQLARGEGFTSLYTYPTHLGSDHAPYPVRWRMPGYAVLGAGLMKLGIALPAGFFVTAVLGHALLVALVFLLATHLHSPKAGAVAAAAALLSPLLLDPYAAGLSQVPTAAISLGAWLLLLRGRGVIAAMGAAVLAAAAWYLRGESMIFVPIWLWLAWRAGGLKAATAFALVYAALCVPWLAALHASVGSAAPLQGNPMLLYTREYPGYSSTRTYGEPMPGMLAYALQHSVALAWRFARDAAGYVVDLLWGLGPFAVGLGIAGLLLRDSPGRWRSLAPALPLLVAAAIQIIAFSFLERSPRFLVPAVPLICVALGLVAAPALDRLRGRRMLAAMFALLLLERAAVVAMETRSAARRFPPLPTSLAGELRAKLSGVPRTIPIWTDAPDWTAWHLDRAALLLPLWRQIGPLSADHPAGAIFLSPDARARNVVDGDLEWVRAIDAGDSIPEWEKPGPLTGGSRLYLPPH